MNRKIFLVLFSFFLFSPLFSQVSETIEIQDILFEYQFYKTQEEFDNYFFDFVLNNTPFTKSQLVHDYKLFGKSFKKNDLLYFEVKDKMIENNYLYSVTTYQENGLIYCVINKKVGDKFYISGWYREF